MCDRTGDSVFLCVSFSTLVDSDYCRKLRSSEYGSPKLDNLDSWISILSRLSRSALARKEGRKFTPCRNGRSGLYGRSPFIKAFGWRIPGAISIGPPPLCKRIEINQTYQRFGPHNHCRYRAGVGSIPALARIGSSNPLAQSPSATESTV